MKVASYMLYTGLPITAEEALKAGLVSRVVPPEQLGEITISFCNEINSHRIFQLQRPKPNEWSTAFVKRAYLSSVWAKPFYTDR